MDKNQAVYGPVKILPPTVVFGIGDLPEAAVAPGVKAGAQNKALFRKSAYRQIQGVYSLLYDVNRNKMEDYFVPNGVWRVGNLLDQHVHDHISASPPDH